MPCHNASATRCHGRTVPVPASTASVTACSASRPWVTNRPRLRFTRSATTPANVPKSRMPTFAQNAITPSNNADPVRR